MAPTMTETLLVFLAVAAGALMILLVIQKLGG